ncbi:hypothetical protein [Cohnella sp.]|uniref:hypothetical protein n=1 Tax=Cohnella sp. TaxID=1883426 RepID=UPI003564A6E4
MLLFIVIFVVSFAIAISLMLRLKKSPKEIAVFVAMSLAGFAIWLLLYFDRPFKPTVWVGWVIDRTGL